MRDGQSLHKIRASFRLGYTCSKDITGLQGVQGSREFKDRGKNTKGSAFRQGAGHEGEADIKGARE